MGHCHTVTVQKLCKPEMPSTCSSRSPNQPERCFKNRIRQSLHIQPSLRSAKPGVAIVRTLVIYSDQLGSRSSPSVERSPAYSFLSFLQTKPIHRGRWRRWIRSVRPPGHDSFHYCICNIHIAYGQRSFLTLLSFGFYIQCCCGNPARGNAWENMKIKS
jgi:hypothetical protein